MPQIHLDDETVERLDAMRVDEQEYDDLVNELIDIYEANEMTLHHGGDVE
ncbi:DUF7557 family protein [Haloparvum sedimenti]|nr:hypothetical protein [Haloparvum sedimenti]